MDSHAGHFSHFFEKLKEFENILKKEILWNRLLLCPLVARKNDKLEFSQTLQKNQTQEGLPPMDMNGFQGQMTKLWPFPGHSL